MVIIQTKLERIEKESHTKSIMYQSRTDYSNRYWLPQRLTVRILDPGPLLDSRSYGDSTSIGRSPREDVDHRCNSSEEVRAQDVITRSLERSTQILTHSHESKGYRVVFEGRSLVWTSLPLISANVDLKAHLTPEGKSINKRKISPFQNKRPSYK
jgi:hypothetical protein